MSGLSDEDWDKFLNGEEPDEELENSEAYDSSPFGGTEEEAPIDPLIFVESDEAPELRFTKPPPTNDIEAETSPVEKPYFVVGAVTTENPWVPVTEVEPDNSIEEVVHRTSSWTSILLRLLLFAAPLLVIAVSFSIALGTR